MKKLIFVVLISILLIPAVAFSAGTMVVVDKGFYTSDGSKIKTLTLTCTAHTDGTFSVQMPTSGYEFMRGWVIFEVRVTNTSAQTDPTVNSDITFTLGAAGFDLLFTAGTDKLDNDAVNSLKPKDANGEYSIISVVDQFFIEVTNNSVNAAIFTIMLVLYPVS